MIVISSTNMDNAKRHQIVPEIHEKDFVFDFVRRTQWKGDYERAVTNYYDLGRYSANLIREYATEVERVCKLANNPWMPKKVMDFAAGYGCATRHLRNVFPESDISSCDIHPEAVTYAREVLDVNSFISDSIPENLALPEQDFIFALSFFTHMPERTYARWFNALVRHLAPGGVLLFTSNGYVTRGKLFPEWQTDSRGFAFRPMSEQHDLDGNEYGLTLAAFPFVWGVVAFNGSVRLSRFQEGVWWGTQDVYVCQRRG